MTIRSIRGKTFLVFWCAYLMAAPFLMPAPVASAAAAEYSIVCDQPKAAGGSCECGDTGDDAAVAGNCLASCCATYVLPAEAVAGCASRNSLETRLLACDCVQHRTAPEPHPPKRIVFL